MALNNSDDDGLINLLDVKKKPKKPITLARACRAELLGTMVLILFGNGVVAQTVLSKGDNGSYLSINFGWGLGVAMGMLCTGSISGAHLNPAISFALALHGKFPWKRVVPYIIAQIIGGFLGAALVFATYYDALHAYDHGDHRIQGSNGTAAMFATYPAPFLTVIAGIGDQVIGTAILATGVFAMIDPENDLAPSPRALPFAVGMLVVAIGASFGLNSGYAINPARDVGPRLFSAFVYGSEVFTVDKYWCLIPAVAPVVGASIGSTLYLWMIR
eukprot:m.47230 g.47230  ORF g.47230 m.47230 type:complete len:273 (-) comp10466_c0_seq2:56-874(-)